MNIKVIFLSICLCLSLVVGAQENPSKAHYPEFSWDTIPVALHFSKRKSDFTKDELRFIARFPLFCIEKHQATALYKDAREGALAAAEGVKRLNPKAKILFYWNSNIDMGKNYFGYNILNEKHHPEWAMKNLKGSSVMIRGAEETYDVRNPEFRAWWYSIPKDVIKRSKGAIEGVYVDAIAHYLREREVTDKKCGEGVLEQVREGVKELFKGIKKELGEDKLIIANNVHAGADFETGIHKYVDGGMIENFCDRASYTPEDMLKQIETVRNAAALGRITMVKCWPRYYFRRSTEYKGLPRETMIEHVKEDITFPLSCFLMGAGEYSYFLYSWGYLESMGAMIDYPEYSKPLGEPLEDAQRGEGWKLSRRFKHADVEVDLETRKAKINWKK